MNKFSKYRLKHEFPSVWRLYKDDKLFKTIFNIVNNTKSKVIRIRIEQIMGHIKEVGVVRKNSSVKDYVGAILELYSYMIIKGVDKHFEKSRSDNYEGFIRRCLFNYLVDLVRKDDVRKKYLVHNEDDTNLHFEGCCDFNRRPQQKPVIPLNIEKLPVKTNIDAKITSKEITNMFKDYYGSDLVELILQDNNLNQVAKKLGIKYTTLVSRIKRSDQDFKEYLDKKGVKYEEIKSEEVPSTLGGERDQRVVLQK